MRKRSYLSFALLLFCGAAKGEWIELDRDSVSVFYYDHSLTERLADGKVSMWLKVSLNLENESAKSPYSLTRYITDCKTWQTARTSTTYYSSDGKNVLQEKNYTPWEFKDIIPNTTRDTLSRAACAKPETTVTNPYLVHWEANDPAAWDEALKQDEILRTSPKWADKPYDVRLKEVVRRVRAIMPGVSTPPRK